MKSIIYTFVALLIVGRAISQDNNPPPIEEEPISDTTVVPYFVMVPPWFNLTRAQALDQLFAHATKRNTVFVADREAVSNTGYYFDESKAGGFVINLNAIQAKALNEDTGYITTPNATYTPVPLDGTATTTNSGWAATAVVPISFTPKTPVREVVLYVVDSGVQPYARNAGNTFIKHPQFASNIKFRQGRTAIGNWPPPSSTDVWTKPVDDLIYPLPDSPWVGTNYLNPQEDTLGHGTKVASVAVGVSVSPLARILGINVQIESIRVYDGSTTDTATLTKGIYHAVDAHLKRVQANNSNPVASVLLIASRTQLSAASNLRFDDSLEAALWWAWEKGMVCVAAGGNDGTKATAGTGAVKCPEPIWYPLPTNRPTSPSRFNWTKAISVNGTGWPPLFTADGTKIEQYPNKPYGILVGGSSATEASPTGQPGWAKITSTTGSSRGNGIDLLAPFLTVPCASTTVTKLVTDDDCLVTGSGTSLSAGYVAGVALAYLATKDPLPTPDMVRTWFLASPGAQDHPCKTSTATIPSGTTVPYLSVPSTSFPAP